MTKYKVIIYKHTLFENTNRSVEFKPHYTNHLRSVFNNVKKLKVMYKLSGRPCNYTVKVETLK